MSNYSFHNDGRVTNAEGISLGVYEESTKTFFLADEELGSFKGAVSRFLNTLHKPVEFWDIQGSRPRIEPDDEGEDSLIPEEAIPPRPKMNPLHGDKTPALVRWLERYRPEEFKERYGVYGRGTVPRYKVDHITGKTVLDRHEEVWLAKRKTCLTERPELPSNVDPNEYDWNA